MELVSDFIVNRMTLVLEENIVILNAQNIARPKFEEKTFFLHENISAIRFLFKYPNSFDHGIKFLKIV